MADRLIWGMALLGTVLSLPGAAPEAPAPEIDLPELRARAEQGDPQAQTTLGTLHQLGQAGLKPNYEEALKWFHKAAQQGEITSMYRIGYMYYSGQGVGQNIGEAVRWFKKSATGGFAVAQFTLGNLFKAGYGVGQSHSEALRWHYYAAEQGYAPAQHQVGSLIFQGQGAPQDYVQGCKWFYLAANQGNENARAALDLALQLIGREELAQAAKLAEAFKPQPPRAVPEKPEPPPIYHELLARANDGDPAAQYHLSLLLQSGQPTNEDLKEARKWVIKAAEGGHPEAQHQLGSMSFLGQGVFKDYTAAYKWLTLAINQGVSNAVQGRERLVPLMTPRQLADAQKQVALAEMQKRYGSPAATNAPMAAKTNAAETSPATAAAPSAPAPKADPKPMNAPTPAKPAIVAENAPAQPSPLPAGETGATVIQLRREAEAGKAESQLSLALMYLHGKGVNANKDEARKWLEQSAGQGHAPAQYWLATTYDATEQAERLKWMRRAADGGFGLAQFMVGQMYFSGGQGAPQDVIEAYKWLHLASQQGNPAADSFLATVAPVMSQEQIDEARRRAEEVAFRLKTR